MGARLDNSSSGRSKFPGARHQHEIRVGLTTAATLDYLFHNLCPQTARLHSRQAYPWGAKMLKLTRDSVETIFGPPDSERALLVIGAGSSLPATPLAKHLKTGLLRAIASGTSFEKHDTPTEDFFTLELVCSLLQARFNDLIALESFFAEALDNSSLPKAALVVAELIRQRRVRYVLTANFDTFIYRALDQFSVPHRVITRSTFNEKIPPSPKTGDVFAFHGTLLARHRPELSPPTSIEARGLATPFTAAMSDYLARALSDVQKIVFWGYSGSDHFDLSPALDDCLQRNDSVKEVHWLSNFAHEKDFSQYVKASACAFGLHNSRAKVYNGEGNIPETVCNGLFNDPALIPSALTVIDPPPKADAEMIERVSAIFGRLSSYAGDSYRTAALEFCTDIFESKIWIPWVLLELYYIDSLSNSEIAQKAFLGVEAANQFFLGINVASLAETILKYWQINRSEKDLFATSITDILSRYDDDLGEIIVQTKFDSVYRSLLSLAASIDMSISDASRKREVDCAFLYVCRALTENYIGLVRLRVLEKIVASPYLNLELEKNIRDKVRRTFNSSIIFANTAIEVESRAMLHESLGRSLTSAELWSRVALFNLGRVTVGREGITIMRQSVDVLLSRSKNENVDVFERGACALQAAHQASIVYKALTGITSDKALPLPEAVMLERLAESDPQISLELLREEKKKALEDCTEGERVFFTLTGRFDSRLLAVADAQVISFLEENNLTSARAIADEYKQKWEKLTNRQYAQWLPNIFSRIDGHQS